MKVPVGQEVGYTLYWCQRNENIGYSGCGRRDSPSMGRARQMSLLLGCVLVGCCLTCHSYGDAEKEPIIQAFTNASDIETNFGLCNGMSSPAFCVLHMGRTSVVRPEMAHQWHCEEP